MEIKYLKHTKGQALLFVVVAMTIAMSVGVAISTRNLSSSSRTARTDTSTRVLAAAEGGIERLLVLPDDDLERIRDGTFCPGDDSTGECIIKFGTTADDDIESQAIVKVENKDPASGEPDTFRLEPGITKEVNLDGYGSNQVQICWNEENSGIYYVSYNSSGDLEKGLLDSGSCSSCDMDGSITATESRSTDGYDYCQPVSIVDSAYGIRVKVLYNPSEVAVYPTSGDLPNQGYNLLSTGQLVQQGAVTVSKVVTVYRSYKYLPGFFDYGVYTNDSL